MVDAAQGVEAQSVANCYTAVEQGLEVVPVLNKLDLPSAEPERVIREIEEIIGIEASDALQISAKTGAGVREVLGDRRMRLVLIMAFVGYPTTATIHGLWGGPYLHDALGLDGVGRGNVLLAMAGGLIVGMLGVGTLDRIFDTRKRLVTFGALTTAALLTVLALAPTPTPVVATLLFGALGVIGAYVIVILAHGRAFFPERLVGRALTAINFAAFMGVAAMQVATGFIVGAFPTSEGAAPEIAYRSVFGFLALMIAIAVAIYRRVEDRRPSDGIPEDGA